VGLDTRTRLLTLMIATLAILLVSCSPQTDNPDESEDVAALATDEPGATESLLPNQVPSNLDDLQFEPRVLVEDQESEGGAVVVDGVEFSDPRGLGNHGWLVIHRDEGGEPGGVLGHVALPPAGLEGPVEIPLDEPLEPEGGVRELQLWAVVHLDGEPQGEFQWPGIDRPLTQNDKVQGESFGVTVTGDTEVGATPSS
jgi:hypothetical protein